MISPRRILALLAAILQSKFQIYAALSLGGATYNAVVVEYTPAIDPAVNSQTNILNNVHNFVQIIKEANAVVQADIIIFPEAALIGYTNNEEYLAVPDPEDNLILCTKGSEFNNALVQLSCAARATATYVVVNLPEQIFEPEVQKVMHYNTDVVFNRDGAVIARYRKINLYGENKQQPIEKKLVYFDTDFGVRFGIFTCFDIIFEYPGVVSRRDYNITHFIFPTAWFSEMPFLTAIQEQWYWSFSQDAVLLASGYNLPVVGSSGTGIYLGRRGPAVYTMAESRGSFLLHAAVPRDIHDTSLENNNSKTAMMKLKTTLSKYVDKVGDIMTNSSSLKLKRDFLDVYATKPIYLSNDSEAPSMGKDLTVKSYVQESLCHNQLCCKFTLNVTRVYSAYKKPISRGDDYSQLNFRMAAFDGVRSYDGQATGGLQTCALMPCVRGDLASCGLRADHPSAQPNTLAGHQQVAVIFDYVRIESVFSNEDSVIGPNVLLGGEGDYFGSLLGPDGFTFTTSNETKSSVVKSLETTHPINNLVTFSLYGRLFGRDGQPYTGSPNISSTCRYNTWALSVFMCFVVKYII